MITADHVRKKQADLSKNKNSEVYKRRQEIDRLVAKEMKSIEGAIREALKEDERSVRISDGYSPEYHVYMWMERHSNNPPEPNSSRDYSDNIAIEALIEILKRLRKHGFKCKSVLKHEGMIGECLEISW